MAERPRFTAQETEKQVTYQEDDISMRGMTPSPSKEILPKTRKIPKQTFNITRSVIQSKHDTVRPPVDFINKNELPPSIKKHLRERANFYRRKLTFYENLGVLAVSLTSDELGMKIKEARQDLNSSFGTENQILSRIDPNSQKEKITEQSLPSFRSIVKSKDNEKSLDSQVKKITENGKIHKKRELLEARKDDRSQKFKTSRLYNLT